jgi:cysteinyl-tRNA synthetase
LTPLPLRRTLTAQSKQLTRNFQTVCSKNPLSASARAGKMPALPWQADVYLEGSDQHRGWFQSSLLLSLAGNGAAPFKTVLTHGFMVDADREKISKSKQAQGGYEKPQTAEAYVKKYGVDIVRLWVASQDYRNDIVVSEERIAKVGETYRGIRNALRYQLSNFTTSIRRSTPSRTTNSPAWIAGFWANSPNSNRKFSKLTTTTNSISSIKKSASSSPWSCPRFTTMSSRTGFTPTRRIRIAAARRKPRCTGW